MTKFTDGLINAFILSVLLTTIMAGSIAMYVMIQKMDKPIEISFADVQDRYMTDEVRDIVMFTERFADNHEYDEETYNCINYSEDMLEVAEALGFDDRIETVIGCNDNLSLCHQWLRLSIDFEPQSGEFVDYSLEYPRMRDVR